MGHSSRKRSLGMALFPPFPTVRKIQEQYTTPRPPPAWPPCTLCNDGSGGGPGGDDEAEDGPGGGAAAAEGPRREGRQGRTGPVNWPVGRGGGAGSLGGYTGVLAHWGTKLYHSPHELSVSPRILFIVRGMPRALKGIFPFGERLFFEAQERRAWLRSPVNWLSAGIVEIVHLN